MKKIIYILSLALVLLSLCSCDNKSEEISTTASTSSPITSTETESTTEGEAISEAATDDTANTAENTETTNFLKDLETSEVRTYYCDDINNKYIKAVEKKYGADASNLIALIRVKASNPGATVLEFSGETDNAGNKLHTKEELTAVYEVSDTDGSIKKATGKMRGNDGYNYAESLAVFRLTRQFILPHLDELKRESPYKG